MSKKANKDKFSSQDYEQKISELTESLQRLQAEFENYKKRQRQEQSQVMINAKQIILSELLPFLDNFELATSHLPKEMKENPWAKGVQYIGQQLDQKFREMDIKKINPIGQKFDHNLHEAIEHVRSDKPEGIITDVITPGYQVGDRVVRPAKVRVSNGQKSEKLIKEDKKNESY